MFSQIVNKKLWPSVMAIIFEKRFRDPNGLDLGQPVGFCLSTELTGVTKWLLVADGHGEVEYRFSAFEHTDKSEATYEAVKEYDELKEKWMSEGTSSEPKKS